MSVLILAWVLGASAEPSEWKQVVDGEVKVFSRSLPSQRVNEVKGEIRIRCTPADVRLILTDEVYAEKAPYVTEFRSVARPDPLTMIQYARLAVPIVADRDYFIRVHLDSDLAADGSGVLHLSWKPAPADQPVPPGVVRLSTNEGFWDVRPDIDPALTLVTYHLLVDPAGSTPAWVINLGTKRMLPTLLRALEQEVLRRKAGGARPTGGTASARALVSPPE